MKRIAFFLLMAAALWSAPPVRAQDAATDERLNKLSARIEDLVAAQAEQDKRITALAKDIEDLRARSSQPNTSYATPEDVRKLTEKLQEIDEKRVADNEKVVKEFEKLVKTLNSSTSAKRTSPDIKPAPIDNSGMSGGQKETGIKYTIMKDDKLISIVQACKEKGIKVTVDQILKANPGLKANNMPVGKEIFIPVTPP